jgi:prevent-host-death family protein
MSIPAAVFKAECLQLMDEVARTGRPVIITKHGKPVAQLVPIPVQPESQFGYMKDTVKIRKDVMAPIDVTWNALSSDDGHLHSETGKTMRRRRGKAGK